MHRARDSRWSSTSDGVTALQPIPHRFPNCATVLDRDNDAELVARPRAAESIGGGAARNTSREFAVTAIKLWTCERRPNGRTFCERLNDKEGSFVEPRTRLGSARPFSISEIFLDVGRFL